MTCDYDHDRFDECLSGHGLYQKTEIPATPFGTVGISFLYRTKNHSDERTARTDMPIIRVVHPPVLYTTGELMKFAM